MHKVFVYGTLLSGEYNHRVLAGAKYLGTATLSSKNFLLFNLGPYPGLHSKDGLKAESADIQGEVYKVDDNGLAHLDQLEGYRASNPERSLYLRITVEVTLTNKEDKTISTMSCLTYTINHPQSERTAIVSGSWRHRHQSNQAAKEVGLFAPQ